MNNVMMPKIAHRMVEDDRAAFCNKRASAFGSHG